MSGCWAWDGPSTRSMMPLHRGLRELAPDAKWWRAVRAPPLPGPFVAPGRPAGRPGAARPPRHAHGRPPVPPCRPSGGRGISVLPGGGGGPLPGPSVALRPVGPSAGSGPPSAPGRRLARSVRLPPGLPLRGSRPGASARGGGAWPPFGGWRPLCGCRRRGHRRRAFCARSWSRCGVAPWGRGPRSNPPGGIVQCHPPGW
uniref:Uncharacterized protein n=1 Tax=uncultured prokaryote TaxID=198431 RepID=A0A0H5Q857_9ZZZZ|nr:hypothetical protein [uncultured prokaryote]